MFSDDEFDLDEKFWNEQLQEEKFHTSKTLFGGKRKSFDLNPSELNQAPEEDPIGLNVVLHKKTKSDKCDEVKGSRKSSENFNRISGLDTDDDSDLNDNLLYSALDSIQDNCLPPKSRKDSSQSKGEGLCDTKEGHNDFSSGANSVTQQLLPSPYFENRAEADTVCQKQVPGPKTTLFDRPNEVNGQNKDKNQDLFQLQSSPTSFDSEFDFSINASPSWNPQTSNVKISCDIIENSVSNKINGRGICAQNNADTAVSTPCRTKVTPDISDAVTCNVNGTEIVNDATNSSTLIGISNFHNTVARTVEHIGSHLNKRQHLLKTDSFLFPGKGGSNNHEFNLQPATTTQTVSIHCNQRKHSNAMNQCNSEFVTPIALAKQKTEKLLKDNFLIPQLTEWNMNTGNLDGVTAPTTRRDIKTDFSIPTSASNPQSTKMDMNYIGNIHNTTSQSTTRESIPGTLHETTPQTIRRAIIPRILDNTNLQSTARDSIPENVHDTRPQSLRRDFIPHNSCTNTPDTGKRQIDSLNEHGIRTPLSVGMSTGKRKRKFPGPAGVLPKLKAGANLGGLNNLKPASPVISLKKEVKDPCDLIPSSQSSEERFQDDLWLTMKRELEPGAQHIITKYCLAEVIKLASKKQLPRGKVPVVCALVEQISTLSADASVLLRDPSSLMKGTIHRQLVKDYPTQLVIGTVLVLRQCGIFSPTPRSHYLNITTNNLVHIYSKQTDGGISSQKISDFLTEDFVIPEPKPPLNHKPGYTSSPIMVGSTTVSPSQQPLFGSIRMNNPRFPPTTPNYSPTLNCREFRSVNSRHQFRTPIRQMITSGRGQSLNNRNNQDTLEHPVKPGSGTTFSSGADDCFSGTDPGFKQLTNTFVKPVQSLSSLRSSSVVSTTCSNSVQSLSERSATIHRPVLAGNSILNKNLQQTPKSTPGIPFCSGNNVQIPSQQAATPDSLKKKFTFKKSPPEGNIQKSVISKTSTNSQDAALCAEKTSLDFSMHDENLDDLLTGIEDELFTEM